MIEAGTRIIDVRQPEEWNRGHIAEAELVPGVGVTVTVARASRQASIIEAWICASETMSVSYGSGSCSASLTARARQNVIAVQLGLLLIALPVLVRLDGVALHFRRDVPGR